MLFLGSDGRPFRPHPAYRLPKKLALAGITEITAANRYIAETYLPSHNACFRATEPRRDHRDVSTAEVADVLQACTGVAEASVYGVAVPFADGRAGMAALVASPELDLAVLHAHVAARLPRYARPVFLRLRHALALTATFKVQKADDARDGFDPARVGDPLLVDDGARICRSIP